jgi:hypothetical protein
MPAKLSTADSGLSQLATTPPPNTASGTSSVAVARAPGTPGRDDGQPLVEAGVQEAQRIRVRFSRQFVETVEHRQDETSVQ